MMPRRGVMTDDFPLSPALLARYRVAASRRMPAALAGPHRRRRAGQSLEFHEFRHYVLGDDVRDIDWRASARLPRAGDFLVRSFAAEQQLRLILSIDTRDTMRQPAPLPKILIARWLVRALASIAGMAGDRAAVHALFGDGAGEGRARAPQNARGREAGAQADALVQAAIAREAGGRLNLASLQPLLRPTAIWVIVTDLYFDDPPPFPFRSLLTRLQDGHRWIVLVELDSWPMERAWLVGGPTLAVPPTGTARAGESRRLELDRAGAEQVGERIAEHTQSLWKGARRGGLSHVVWRWPAPDEADAAAFFRARFLADPVLKRIFRREP